MQKIRFFDPKFVVLEMKQKCCVFEIFLAEKVKMSKIRKGKLTACLF